MFSPVIKTFVSSAKSIILFHGMVLH